MTTNKQCQIFEGSSIDLSDDDVLAAMKSIPGYIDITTADFKEIYGFAYRHAFERLGRSVTATNIMTTAVISVLPETDLIETANQMASHSISGLPVVDSRQKVIGVISEKDFFRKMGAKDGASFMGVVAECLANKGCLAIPMRGKSARDIMTAPAVTADLRTTISELSRMMKDHYINRIPIIDDEGKLAGIVSRGDLVGSFCAKVL
ncbi:MAG: CBS domain-containing protein [Desulfobacteraceae bacterium]|jgi:CBS domain-containing protein|nr:MAG: CBS domain-containing protein [Desulfobacteraceae bacterium]